MHQQFPEGQAIVAEMLAKAHETMRQLLLATDYYRVDSSLYSIHDRLDYLTMRLKGLMNKENVSERDLTSLRDKLQHIDAEWKEGTSVVWT